MFGLPAVTRMGYWCQRTAKRLGNLPESNQEALSVISSLPFLGELRVNKFMECDTFSFQCSDTFGWVTGGYPACKKLGVGMLVVTL